MSVIARLLRHTVNVENVRGGRMAASARVACGSSRTCRSTGRPQRMKRGSWVSR